MSHSFAPTHVFRSGAGGLFTVQRITYPSKKSSAAPLPTVLCLVLSTAGEDAARHSVGELVRVDARTLERI
jgi:hypothetical protein